MAKEITSAEFLTAYREEITEEARILQDEGYDYDYAWQLAISTVKLLHIRLGHI